MPTWAHVHYYLPQTLSGVTYLFRQKAHLVFQALVLGMTGTTVTRFTKTQLVQFPPCSWELREE